VRVAAAADVSAGGIAVAALSSNLVAVVSSTKPCCCS